MSNKKGKGRRAKTRQKFSRKGAPLTIRTRLADFKPGTKVHITVDPSVHGGHTFKRFVGLTGEVIAKKGRTGVVVEFFDQNKSKQWTFTPAHLRQVKAPGTAKAA
ncbi:MAG: 50S ribosomal protein L21e [Candidatus Micrarchaeota archaeon]